jgi:uncharacterized membrane protein YgdD (TMEM256/DUF423 family)
MNSLLWKLGSVSAGSAVIIAAAGGHKPWEIERKMTFNTAFILHLSSSIGIMLCSTKQATIPAFLFFVGLGLFSFTAYYRCNSDNKQYNYLMPYGGSMIILAWLALAIY